MKNPTKAEINNNIAEIIKAEGRRNNPSENDTLPISEMNLFLTKTFIFMF